jgi:hypothetical protein
VIVSLLFVSQPVADARPLIISPTPDCVLYSRHTGTTRSGRIHIRGTKKSPGPASHTEAYIFPCKYWRWRNLFTCDHDCSKRIIIIVIHHCLGEGGFRCLSHTRMRTDIVRWSAVLIIILLAWLKAPNLGHCHQIRLYSDDKIEDNNDKK